ncbi:GNAT family N-acetyltransferase [Kiloniella laminariae]|uniref:GNAT family N-acetyltransferase n=1 Tax=Kiloniella laminariae TaxID=454162 RepID=A0ABT4LN81_9PROT|nr:GNAT family N-acetyltransferase [Kiloniella laminariae]MCZ4282539.1 GNAT family N-acetyltransferase [Kiloniella laminariae]
MPDNTLFLKHLPLETDRLRIRRYREDDLELSRAMSQAPELRKWTVSGIYSDREHSEYVACCCAENPRDFIIEDRFSTVVVGEMTFHPWYVERTWEIGWLILPDYQGRGYATEAAKALVKNGFINMNLHRIVAKAHPENLGSWRIMEKIGMRREGYFRQCIPRADGSWWDEVFYSILSDEYSTADLETFSKTF